MHPPAEPPKLSSFVSPSSSRIIESIAQSLNMYRQYIVATEVLNTIQYITFDIKISENI